MDQLHPPSGWIFWPQSNLFADSLTNTSRGLCSRRFQNLSDWHRDRNAQLSGLVIESRDHGAGGYGFNIDSPNESSRGALVTISPNRIRETKRCLCPHHNLVTRAFSRIDLGSIPQPASALKPSALQPAEETADPSKRFILKCKWMGTLKKRERKKWK